MAFKLGKEKRQIRSSSSTPIFRKKLDSGIMGEANSDGSIYIDKSVEPGSMEEQHVLVHEMQHINDMKTGRTTYTDEYVLHDGQKWMRINGDIINPYTGKAVEEGGDLPWENNKV